MDFGSIIIKPTKNKNLAKLDKVQNAVLRIICGCMKSTPTNILLAENAEISLEYGRRYLASKFLLKRFMISNPIRIIVQKLKKFVPSNNKYWKNKDSPYVLLALDLLNPHSKILNISNTFPCFSEDHWTQVQGINIRNFNLKKGDNNVHLSVKLELENFKDYKIIYSGASKLNDRVEMGIYS